MEDHIIWKRFILSGNQRKHPKTFVSHALKPHFEPFHALSVNKSRNFTTRWWNVSFQSHKSRNFSFATSAKRHLHILQHDCVTVLALQVARCCWYKSSCSTCLAAFGYGAQSGDLQIQRCFSAGLMCWLFSTLYHPVQVLIYPAIRIYTPSDIRSELMEIYRLGSLNSIQCYPSIPAIAGYLRHAYRLPIAGYSSHSLHSTDRRGRASLLGRRGRSPSCWHAMAGASKHSCCLVVFIGSKPSPPPAPSSPFFWRGGSGGGVAYCDFNEFLPFPRSI